MTCHNCKSLAQKFGWFISGSERIQRYRCKQCGKTFGDIPQRPLDDLRTPLDKAAQVVHLLCEGVGVRAASRLAGVDKHTVLAILDTVGAKCARVLDRKVQFVTANHVEVDETWSFCYCKQRNAGDDPEKGDQYVWLGCDRDSKLIISYRVGKRDREQAGFFMADLRKRIANRFQLSTDGFSGYGGFNGSVREAFGNGIDFASITKLFAAPTSKTSSRYSQPRCIGIKKIPQIGCPHIDFICTSHVERQNLSLRLFNRRMTRLTLGYSKKLRNLERAIALQIAYHNFCRVHSTVKSTPAQAAGLTDHKWTIEELIKAADC